MKGLIIRLCRCKNSNGIYLIGKTIEFDGGERKELPECESILKLTSKTDKETSDKITAVLEVKGDEITDLYANNRLEEAQKYFGL